MQLFFESCSSIQTTSVTFFLYYFRNVLSTSCTTIPLLESPSRETLKSLEMANATDGILGLTVMNVVVPSRSIQSFTMTGMEGFLILPVPISSKVIVRTLHEAQSGLNSG